MILLKGDELVGGEREMGPERKALVLQQIVVGVFAKAAGSRSHHRRSVRLRQGPIDPE